MEQTTADQLIADLQAVIRDAENLLRATAAQGGEKLGEKFQEIRAKTEKTVRQAKDRLADVEQDALERAEALANDTNEFVRANPWQAVGIAAGVGLLLGLLMRRR
jgi:ElaB/YqjD/DUF883 family membrane-anchored ribosome-binding protein